MYFNKMVLIILLAISLIGCGENMLPSDKDNRAIFQPGSSGNSVSQLAPIFSISDISGNVVNLSSSITGKRGAVFYFTMWCSICDLQMSELQAMLPSYQNINFYLVDYVSGSIIGATDASRSAGYLGSQFTILSDNNQNLLATFQATMGTTVVIDSNAAIKMNEDFKDGEKLKSVLSTL